MLTLCYVTYIVHTDKHCFSDHFPGETSLASCRFILFLTDREREAYGVNGMFICICTSGEVLVWLSVWSELQMISIWSR